MVSLERLEDKSLKKRLPFSAPIHTTCFPAPSLPAFWRWMSCFTSSLRYRQNRRTGCEDTSPATPMLRITGKEDVCILYYLGEGHFLPVGSGNDLPETAGHQQEDREQGGKEGSMGLKVFIRGTIRFPR